MKKLLFICIMLIVVISCSPFANAMSLVYLTPTPNALPGDINCDGVVNAEDALNILRYAVNPYGGNCAYAYWLGDVDGTRTVDAIDALYVLQLAVHQIQRFPVDRSVRLDNFQCSHFPIGLKNDSVFGNMYICHNAAEWSKAAENWFIDPNSENAQLLKNSYREEYNTANTDCLAFIVAPQPMQRIDMSGLYRITDEGETYLVLSATINIFQEQYQEPFETSPEIYSFTVMNGYLDDVSKVVFEVTENKFEAPTQYYLENTPHTSRHYKSTFPIIAQ